MQCDNEIQSTIADVFDHDFDLAGRHRPLIGTAQQRQVGGGVAPSNDLARWPESEFTF
jgi:hypothetical protein